MDTFFSTFSIILSMRIELDSSIFNGGFEVKFYLLKDQMDISA
jgi:hypothetical protein